MKSGKLNRKSKIWCAVYFRAKRWPNQLKVKEIKNPLTSNDEERVMFKSNGKELLIPKESEKEAIVEGNRKLSKNDGAHKLYHRIRQRWCGISRPFIQRIINKNQHVQQSRPRFDNKAPLASQGSPLFQNDVL